MLRFNSAFSHHAAAPFCAAAARRNVSFLCRKATANVSAGARRNRLALQAGKLGCWFWVGALPHPSKMGSFYAGSGSRASRLPLHRDCSGSRERPEVHGMVLYLFHPMRALCGIGVTATHQSSKLRMRVQLSYAAPCGSCVARGNRIPQRSGEMIPASLRSPVRRCKYGSVSCVLCV